MGIYHYTECGLENVFIEGAAFAADDAGEDIVAIPNVNGLHRAIATSIITRKSGMSGRELRFLRTEMGMTQAQLADMIHREPLTISRWERGEITIDSNAETLIRLHADQDLALGVDASVMELSHWSVPGAEEVLIQIDGTETDDYRPKLAA